MISACSFKKIKDIDQGAMGLVYQAADPTTHELVAVKRVRYDVSPQQRDMFLREVSTMMLVEHETILRLRNFMSYSEASPDDPPVIVTDYMDGGSLQSVIDLAPPVWDDTKRLIVIYGTAVGMMILHSNRIIHRDLKPRNILLNKEFEPKVADFGLSKVVATGETSHQTMHGGTYGYMAPEILDGLDYDFSVDVFAFGMLMYATLTGLPPFPAGANPMSMSRKLIQGERPNIPANVSPAYRALIEACWDGNPTARPSFRRIVTQIELGGFITDAVNKRAFAVYQAKVATCHIPNIVDIEVVNQWFGGLQRLQIEKSLAESGKIDSAFLIGLAKSLRMKLPSRILFQILLSPYAAHELGEELMLNLMKINPQFSSAACQGILELFRENMPDLDQWFHTNGHVQDLIGDFRAFLEKTRVQRQHAVINGLSKLMRELPRRSQAETAWNAVLSQARALHPKVPIDISDTVIFRPITPGDVKV
jgi:serine/threonine protein kinase